MQNYNRLFLAMGAAFTLSACSPAGQSAETLAVTAVTNLGCKLSQSEMWTALQKVAEEGHGFPSAAQLKSTLKSVGEARGYVNDAAFDRYVEAFVANYVTTIDGIRSKFGPDSEIAWRRALAELEVGLRVTEAHAELTSEVQASLKNLKSAEEEMNATCSQPARQPAGEIDPVVTPPAVAASTAKTVWEQLKATAAPEVYGARRVVATAYQSCDVLALAPMNSGSPYIDGIVQDSKPNPQNGGILRHYGSVNSINASHYYLRDSKRAKTSCYDVKKTPPIYDFGGKPYTTSSLPTVLNMFRDAGSGSEVMGIDCSGFIFSSLAAAGLKIIDPDPAKPLKATMVLATPAAAMKEPQSNGLGCLSKVPVTGVTTLQAGDIVASSGHVIMIDSVGADPLGILKATSLSGCGDLSYLGFDFVVAQSSPSNGSIGINRYRAKDYLAKSSTMREGLTAYAVAACRTRFGASASLSSPSMSVVRHKKTPECRIASFTLTNESCVDSCPATP